MVPKPSKMKTIYFDSVASTMDEALKYIDEEEEEIIVLIAKEQTEGRGRKESSWISPKGGFYATYIVPLEKELTEVDLTFFHYAAALAIQEMLLILFQVKSKIKWPNDVYLYDKKIAGVLIEYIMGEKNHILIGIGINVNNESNDLSSILNEQAISLQTVLKAEISIKDIESELSKLITKNTLQVLNSELEYLTRDFNSNLINYKNQIYLKDGSIRICKGIDKKGNLVLEKDNHKKLLSINDSDEITEINQSQYQT